MIKKFTLSAILILVSLFSAPVLPVASAEAPAAPPTATPDPTASASTSSAETQKVLENLERIARDKDQSEQIKNIYEDINVKKRGYIAQVASIKDKTVKVRITDETEEFLTFDKSTALISKGKETTADQVELADWLNIDDWLVIIGVKEEDQFLPRRVLISSVDLTPREKVVHVGTVKEITKNKLTYQPKNTEATEEMKIDKNTTLKDKDGQILKLTQVTPDLPVLVSGIVPSSGGTPTASTILITTTVE